MVVPKINDTLLISNPNSKSYKYVFLGFDFDAIYARSVLSDKESFVKMLSSYSFKIDSKEYLNPDWIKNGIEYKTIPIMSRMNVESNSDTISIYYHDIQKINTKSSSYSAFIILAGVAADLLFLKSIDFPHKPGGGSIW